MGSERFQPAGSPGRNSGLREWVRGEIWARIADGRIRPGERLLEREVAEGLAVSRVPVREAFRLLEAEGYVSSGSGGAGGVKVRELSRDEVDEMFDVREALEALAARLAARNAGDADIEQMEAVLKECRVAIDSSDGPEIGRLNREFHHLIRRATGNRFIAERIEPLIGRLMWAFRESPEPERVWSMHRSLLDAIAAKDEDAAARVAQLDNRHNRQVALDHLGSPRTHPWS